jgi:hypothetical protein
VHKRAMAEGENANAAGHLDLKVRERRAHVGVRFSDSLRHGNDGGQREA